MIAINTVLIIFIGVIGFIFFKKLLRLIEELKHAFEYRRGDNDQIETGKRIARREVLNVVDRYAKYEKYARLVDEIYKLYGGVTGRPKSQRGNDE